MIMLFRNFKEARTLSACLALLTGLLWAPLVWAHGGSHGAGAHRPAAPANRSTPRPAAGPRNDPEFRAPHGGQLSRSLENYFEIVYGPQETRVYVYDMYRYTKPAREIQGWATMRVRSTGREYRYPVKYAPTSGSPGYLTVRVDLTRVHDGDMEVEYKLEGVPSQFDSSAQFMQMFALTRPPVQVTVARLTEADRPLVERQRVCPVMDAGLREHGEPIKLMVGGQPLFVCCEGCIDDVKKNPRKYLPKAATAVRVQANRPPARPHVAVFWASQADDAAIRAQGNCPVMDQPLGAHGKPLKVVIDGRPIFVCCEGCIDKVVQDRNLYFNKLAGATAGGQGFSPSIQQVPPRRNIMVSNTTQADQAAIQAQGDCPVMNQPLGGHGAPIKIAIDGQSVFVCCQGCVNKVKQNPDLYLSKIARGRQTDRYGRQDDSFYRKPEPSASGSGGSCCSGSKKGSKKGASCH